MLWGGRGGAMFFYIHLGFGCITSETIYRCAPMEIRFRMATVVFRPPVANFDAGEPDEPTPRRPPARNLLIARRRRPPPKQGGSLDSITPALRATQGDPC